MTPSFRALVMGLIRFIALISILALRAALMLPIADAAAHGEKSQPASLRMLTIHWYDTEISKTSVAVNETLALKGRFYVSNAWPKSLPKPIIAFLHTASPAPGLMRLDIKINGATQFKPSGFQSGKHYAYEIVLKGRVPSRSHVHVVLHVNDAGPLIGPGKWIEISGDLNDFNHRVKSITGAEFNIETQGRDEDVTWYVIWVVLGILWVAYLVVLKGPILPPRASRVIYLGKDSGQFYKRFDLLVGAVMLFATAGAVIGSYIWAVGNNPLSIPLQTGTVDVEPLPDPQQTVGVKLKRAVYFIPGRSFQMEIEVTNDTNTPLRLGEFSTSYVRFINPNVLRNVKVNDPDEAIALDGLIVEGGFIAPGETKTIRVKAEDSIWETERLSKLINTSDSRFSALMHFYTSAGQRMLTEITGLLIPSYI